MTCDYQLGNGDSELGTGKTHSIGARLSMKPSCLLALRRARIGTAAPANENSAQGSKKNRAEWRNRQTHGT